MAKDPAKLTRKELWHAILEMGLRYHVCPRMKKKELLEFYLLAAPLYEDAKKKTIKMIDDGEIVIPNCDC